MYETAVQVYPLLVSLKFGVIFSLMGLASIGFGATVPALLRSYRDVARESGQLLFYSSVANALGFLLMAFVLHRYLDYGPILLAIAAVTAGAILVHSGWRRRASLAGIGLLAVAAVAYATGWDEMLLYRGHTNFHALMQPEQGAVTAKHRFKGAQDVFAITVQDGRPYFFINGYISIPLSNASEKIVGALSAMISPRLDEALVLGVGSGATAATVGLLFEHADAVEINKVVLDNLHLMSEYNFDIQALPGLEIHHDDGIHFLRTGEKKYSLILNTVTSPLYFSSSKLYTKDLFDLAVDRLTPDGVYMTWIDVEIGDGGMAIILESLGRSFEHCWLSVIKNDYFLLGCSNEEIRLRQFEAVAANPTLKNYLADEHAIPIRFLHYNVISTDALALGAPPPVPVNTLDFPVLEFEMAQLQADRLTGFKRRLDRRMDLKGLQETLGRDVDWLAEEFALNLDLRLPRRSLYSLLEEHITRVFPEAYGRYVGTVRSAVAEFESAGAAWTLAKRLKRRDRLDAADAAYRRVLELDPSFPGAHLALARARYDAEQYDVALEHLRTEWAHGRDGDTAHLMARTLIALEHYDVALRWLDTATDMDGFRDRPYREHYYRGIAHEGLLQLEQARREFGQALRLNPDSVSTRRALNRVESAL
jgi:tetratricopeptide (TPR) repeat protein